MLSLRWSPNHMGYTSQYDYYFWHISGTTYVPLFSQRRLVLIWTSQKWYFRIEQWSPNIFEIIVRLEVRGKVQRGLNRMISNSSSRLAESMVCRVEDKRRICIQTLPNLHCQKPNLLTLNIYIPLNFFYRILCIN